MNEFIKWALIGFFAISMLSTIALIGKERQPITPVAGVLSVIFNGIIVWCILLLK